MEGMEDREEKKEKKEKENQDAEAFVIRSAQTTTSQNFNVLGIVHFPSFRPVVTVHPLPPIEILRRENILSIPLSNRLRFYCASSSECKLAVFVCLC
jgi:hypothetical protein